MKATFIRAEDTALRIKTFWFEPESQIHYVPGQFTELYLPHPHPDARGQKHWFTISSSPTEKLLSITTKFSAQQESTFKKTLNELTPGTVVELAEPMGDFVLPKDPTIPLVFIGGGIGVTPFHSMCCWLRDSREKRTITMLYAANSIEEIAFRELFEKTTASFQIILAAPPEGWTGPSGHLSAARILELAPSVATQRVYLSGPEPMVEALGVDLEKLGVPKEELVIDYFPGYQPI